MNHQWCQWHNDSDVEAGSVYRTQAKPAGEIARLAVRPPPDWYRRVTVSRM